MLQTWSALDSCVRRNDERGRSALGSGFFSSLIGHMFIEEPEKDAESFVSILLNRLLGEKPSEGNFSSVFPEGAVLLTPSSPDYPGHGQEIKKLDAAMTVAQPIVTEILIRAEEYIYMILEGLYDGRRFRILQSGEIVVVKTESV